MAINPGTLRAKAISVTPPAPSAGYVILYFKTDNVLYIQGSDAVEHAIGIVSDITDLHGDVVAHGPGDAATTVVQVGGKLAADIAQSVTDTQNATALNIINTIVKRDSSGNIFVNQINGVTVESHASRHLPGGADPLTTAAPVADLTATTPNAIGNANSLSRSDHSHAIDTGTASSQTPDQTNAPGISPNLARADHVHNIPTAAPPSDLNANTSNGQGIANSFARSDHSHAIDTGTPIALTPDQTNSAGTSPNLVRADHEHNVPTDAPVQVNANGSNNQGSAAKFSRADHKHDIATATPVTQNTNQANSAGSSSSLSRADHVHNIPTAAPIIQTPDQTNADGFSVSFSRADHVHDIPTAAPVADLTANTTNAKGTGTSFARNDHSHAIDTGTPSTQNADQSNAPGSSANLARADHIHNIPTAVAVDVGSSNSQGSSGSFSKADHVHKGVRSLNANGGTQEFGDLELVSGAGINISDIGGVFTLSTTSGTNEFVTTIGTGLSVNYTDGNVLINGTYSAIVSSAVSVSPGISNGWIYVTTTNVIASGSTLPAGAIAIAQFTSNATNVIALHDRRTYFDQNIQYDTPTTNLDSTTSNAQGSADSVARSDHSHAISTGTPSTQIPDQSNSAGSSANLAKADHIHNIPTAAPVVDLTAVTTNADGSASTFSRSDHSHAIDTGTPSTQTPDQSNAIGTSPNLARADHIHNIPTTAPASQIADAVNADGTSANFSRADHIHNIATDVPVQIGTVNSQGGSTKFAKADHVHNHGNQTSPTLHALATGSAHGFQSSTDKAKSDAELPASLGTSNQVLGVNAAGTAGEYKTLAGTANQVIITEATGSKTFSTPQDIATTSKPTFAGENLTDRLELTEQVAPATPAATKLDIFTESSNGFTRLRALDSTGLKSTILRDNIILVKNMSGSSISSGKGIYYTGADVTTNLPTIGLAKADSSTTMPLIGLMLDTTANGSVGRVLTLGIISNIDTSAFSQGDSLYVSATTAGSFTNVKPTSPNIWQRVGIVLISNASTGSIEVRPFGTHGEESGTNTSFALNTVTLTDAANIATDASLGNTFSVTLGGNRNLSAPTNPRDGQKITYRIKQDATGGRGLTFDAIFNFGLDILSFTPSSGANKTDYIGCMYNSGTTKWDVVAVSKGF